MERNNYNRGGNNGGNVRGGRSNRGRGFSDSQDGGGGNQNFPQQKKQYGGGSAGGGRGSNGFGGGGYYRRGGGNQNFQQQNSKQQPDQYGRVGGRGSGGGGGRGSIRGGRVDDGDRYQQTNRTPDYTRQNVDRVPERSPVGSVQSVNSPTQMLTHRVSDLRIQDLDPTNVFVPITRPDRGTLALNSVRLLVNHFPVKFDPSNSILHYNVDVKQEGKQEGPSSKTIKKSIPKSDLRLIQEKLCSEYSDIFPLLQTAYDGEKNIYSAVTLKPGTYTVQLFGRSYTCTIKYSNELNLSKLQDFLNGNTLQIPRDVLQALDVVMKANLFREKVSVGRGLYPRVHRREDDLRCGVAAYRGSQQSLKATSNGLVICTDYSAIPFRKRMPVLDFLKEHIWDIQEVNDIPKCRNKVMRALKGLRVSVTHRRTNQKYIVSGLTDQLTRDLSFELEDLEANNETQVVMLTDYFREKWGKEIVHVNIPCLKLGNSKKPNYVPMELCFLAEDKPFPKEQLGKEAAEQLKDLCLLAPDNRRNEIRRMVREEFDTGRHGAEVIANFEVGVGMNMTEVDGRVMAPPRLKLGSLDGKPNIVTVDKFKCDYNLVQGKTLVAGKYAERWALIDFSSGDRRNWVNLDSFIPKLMNRCRSIGVKMEEPLFVYPTDTRELSDVNTVRGVLKWVVEECNKKDKGRLQMIVCVMAEKHEGYKYLKWVSETEIGVMTQCCLSQNANKNKGSDQFLANLGMKINAKLGGSNVELIEKFPCFSGEDHFMFIGADVNHPAAANKFSPSVAAIVGSMNWPAASIYTARVSPQKHRQEEIMNFGKSCLDLVNTYAKMNGVKPNKIVVFRDGVGDGQFDMVLNKEMVDIKKAIYTERYRPFITFVVAQKRHTTRLFLNNGKDVGNVPPGTVVDTKIVHPVEFDFYLCSHLGGIGTSKSTHYTVIWDEIGFTSDEIQKLIYHLCYIFARCTKPVSLVPPVYYADLVAYRGRMFQEVVMETQSGSENSSFDQFFYTLEDHLKDSMFFI